MGFGSTAKKLQKVADVADDLYTKVTELKEQLQSTQETVEETSTRVDELDEELAEQRALLEALADEQGLDTDAVLAGMDPDDGAETPTDSASTD